MTATANGAVLLTEEKGRGDETRDTSIHLPPLPHSQTTSTGSTRSNPFVMPPDHELFVLREKERQKLREERARERKLHVHEKTTYASRMNARMASLRKAAMSPDSAKDEMVGLEKASRLHEESQFVLATTRDRRIEKEDLNSYIGKKREMFLLQYSLGVKRDEIRKLQEIAKEEERKLKDAEKYLEQSATMFDEFLKENDKNSVEAIKMAEVATKAKLEKVAEIKRRNTQIMAIKSEISRYDEQLNELQLYREFLYELSPQEWKDLHHQPSDKNGAILEEESSEKIYFTDPQQLLDIFTELEELNLSLIQNSQETEESLEEIRLTRLSTQEQKNMEVETLKVQIEALNAAINKEQEKASNLQTKAQLFSFGEFKAEDQEEMLKQLDKKVSEVYTKLIGPAEPTLSTLQMLTAIEGLMEQLFDELEGLPPDKVEAAEKNKDKVRRMKMREKKLIEQRQHQEERLKRALERSQADTHKKLGRKLVYRSEPPMLKKKEQHGQDLKEKEEEEMLYFFT